MNLAWIPNSLTMGNLLFGFFSIIFASNGQYVNAGIFILGAALLDGLDGQAARALKVQSEVGKELDSLADNVTFGVAPGYLAYQAYLSGIIVPVFGKPVDFGIFIASIFPICAAYRLARFNVKSVPDAFDGLPSPVAGVILALVPICFRDVYISKTLFGILFVIVALLMVSTVRYVKPQSFIFKQITGIKLGIFIIVIIALIFMFKQWTVFVFIALYIISGIFSFIIQLIQDYRY